MTDGAPRVIAVTGATGFIGRNLCDRFAGRGWVVRALVRDTTTRPWSARNIASFHCDLPDTIDPLCLREASAVIHCAYVTRHKDLAEARRVNEIGTTRLIEHARQAGVPRFVFISSQSAHAGALSYYGRSKRALEQHLDPGRDLAIRPGLVLGPGEAGLFSRMCETVRRSMIIPLFGGGRQPLQTIHIEDLCAAVLAAVERSLTGTLTIAEPDPIPMRDFLSSMAERLGRRPLFLPVPMAPALLALRSFETLRLPLPVSSENLLGLKQMRADDTRRDLALLGVRARTAIESLNAILTRPGGAPS